MERFFRWFRFRRSEAPPTQEVPYIDTQVFYSIRGSPSILLWYTVAYYGGIYTTISTVFSVQVAPPPPVPSSESYPEPIPPSPVPVSSTPVKKTTPPPPQSKSKEVISKKSKEVIRPRESPRKTSKEAITKKTSGSKEKRPKSKPEVYGNWSNDE